MGQVLLGNLSQCLIKKKNIKVNIVDNLITGKLSNLSQNFKKRKFKIL